MIDAKRYTRHDLQNGALDLRYNTKAELAGGELDSRYYTKTALDAGQLDSRYYTEAEVAAILAFYASLYDPTQTIVADVLKALRLNLGGSDTPTKSRLRIEGTDTSETNGPHAEIIGSADDYPLLHLLGWTHDNVALSFDGYYDSGWKASDATGFQLYKIADQLKIRRHTGSTPGGTSSYIDVLVIDLTTGNISITADLSVGTLGGAWTNLALGSDWANFPGYQRAQYKKVGDIVLLRGLVYRPSGSSTTILTLPSGTRPPDDEIIGTYTNTGPGAIGTAPSGAVTLLAGGAGWVSLSPVRLSTT